MDVLESWATSRYIQTADVISDFQVWITSEDSYLLPHMLLSTASCCNIHEREANEGTGKEEEEEANRDNVRKLPIIETGTDSIDGRNGCSSQCSAHTHNHQQAPHEHLLTPNNRKKKRWLRVPQQIGAVEIIWCVKVLVWELYSLTYSLSHTYKPHLASTK